MILLTNDGYQQFEGLPEGYTGPIYAQSITPGGLTFLGQAYQGNMQPVEGDWEYNANRTARIKRGGILGDTIERLSLTAPDTWEKVNTNYGGPGEGVRYNWAGLGAKEYQDAWDHLHSGTLTPLDQLRLAAPDNLGISQTRGDLQVDAGFAYDPRILELGGYTNLKPGMTATDLSSLTGVPISQSDFDTMMAVKAANTPEAQSARAGEDGLLSDLMPFIALAGLAMGLPPGLGELAGAAGGAGALEAATLAQAGFTAAEMAQLGLSAEAIAAGTAAGAGALGMSAGDAAGSSVLDDAISNIKSSLSNLLPSGSEASTGGGLTTGSNTASTLGGGSTLANAAPITDTIVGSTGVAGGLTAPSASVLGGGSTLVNAIPAAAVTTGTGVAGGLTAPATMGGGSTLVSAGASAAPTILSQLKDLVGGESNLALMGKLLGTGLGMYGANLSADDAKALADKFDSYGAPYRQKLSDLYANPDSFLQSDEVQKPVQMGTDNLARSLSMSGNPTGSGRALQQLQSYASDQLFGKLGQEKDRLAGFGGLANYNAAAPGAAAAASSSGNNWLNVAGAGIADIFSPPKTYTTLSDLLSGRRP